MACLHGVIAGNNLRQCESFDYLFESAVKMRSFGLDPGAVPKHGTYREGTKRPLQEHGVHTQAKKA